MNTTQKTEINEFPLSVDFFDKPEICAVTIEHGIKGQAATMMLLCAIYRNGYFIEWKPENFLPILKELPGIKIKKIEKIVKTLVEWGFFDRTLFEQHQVLSNREIQKYYLDATRLENPTVDDSLPYWLIDENDNEDTDNDGYHDDTTNEDYNDDTANEDYNEWQPLSFPAEASVTAINLMEDNLWVDSMCEKYEIDKNELDKWVDQFVTECETDGNDIFDNIDDFVSNFDTWIHSVKNTIPRGR